LIKATINFKNNLRKKKITSFEGDITHIVFAFQLMFYSYDNKQLVYDFINKNKIYKFLSKVKIESLMILKSFSPYLYNFSSYREDEFYLIDILDLKNFDNIPKYFQQAHEFIIKFIKDNYKKYKV